MQTTTTDVDLFKSLSIQSGQTGLENLAPQELPLTVVIPSFYYQWTESGLFWLVFIVYSISDHRYDCFKCTHVHGDDDATAGYSSLPFKLMLFVVVDGWGLLVKTWSWPIIKGGQAMSTGYLIGIFRDAIFTGMKVAGPIY